MSFARYRIGNLSMEGAISKGLRIIYQKNEFVSFNSSAISRMNFSGDGTVSFEEFVEIVSNIGDENSGTLADQDQEEQELRDAFRVSPLSFFYFK